MTSPLAKAFAHSTNKRHILHKINTQFKARKYLTETLQNNYHMKGENFILLYQKGPYGSEDPMVMRPPLI
jgi:hypothetical protein